MIRAFRLALFALVSVAIPAMASDESEIKAFDAAVQIGDTATVQKMLADKKQLATSADEYGFQPIHLMDMYPDEAILNLLLENGADINARNDDGVTILHIVTDPNAVPMLVKSGAMIDARDKNGWTPLIMQADNQENGPDVVEALLSEGANPNAKGENGVTALALAKETGNQSLIDVLKAGGAAE